VLSEQLGTAKDGSNLKPRVSMELNHTKYGGRYCDGGTVVVVGVVVEVEEMI
jgi:hypothetical protein